MPVLPVERNNHSEPNAGAFIFGFDFLPDGSVRKLEWDAISTAPARPPRRLAVAALQPACRRDTAVAGGTQRP